MEEFSPSSASLTAPLQAWQRDSNPQYQLEPRTLAQHTKIVLVATLPRNFKNKQNQSSLLYTRYYSRFKTTLESPRRGGICRIGIVIENSAIRTSESISCRVRGISIRSLHCCSTLMTRWEGGSEEMTELGSGGNSIESTEPGLARGRGSIAASKNQSQGLIRWGQVSEKTRAQR
jgi:hypothetical protein